MMPCTDTPQPHVLYLALGTNLGDKQLNLLRALDLIGRCVGQVCRISSFMCTEPWGFSSDNAFLNAACMVHTVLTPLQCLERTQQIERQMGRTLKSGTGTIMTASSISTCSSMTVSCSPHRSSPCPIPS